jgi:PAS domain S-box-containing protein
MYGYSAEEAVRITWGDTSGGFPPYTVEDANCRIVKAAKEGPQLFEWPAKHKGGGLFWVEVSARIAVTGSGNFIIATTRDITGRKRIEGELTTTKNYLNTVFNNIHDAVFIHDVDGKVIDVNDKMLDMYQFTREEAIGLSIVPDYTVPGDPVDHRANWKKAMAGEDQFFECTGRRPKDGYEFMVDAFLTKLSLPEGDFILASVRDITKRKRVEKELHATKEYLATVFNNIHDAVFIHDVDGKVIDVNDKMLDMYQFTREEAIGLSIMQDYTIQEGRPDLPAIWRRVVAGEDGFIECTGRRPKDGYQFDVEVFMTKLSLPDGDYVLASVRDITQRRIVEKKFQVLSEGSPVGMAVIDAHSAFGFKYMNPKFRELFSCDMEDVPDVHEWLTRIYPDPVSHRKAASNWVNILETVKPGIDRPFVRKLGNKGKPVRYVKFVPVQLQTGEILMACWDITKNIEAEQRIRERNLVLEVLNDIMTSVTGSLSLSKILQALQRVFVEKLRIGAGGIFFRSEVDGRTNEGICWGVPADALEGLRAFALKCRSDGKVIHENDIALVRHHPPVRGSYVPEEFRKFRWHSFLCISLPIEGETQGMIFLAEGKRDAFNDDQAAFFKALGQQIGVAVQNAHLFEQVRQSHAEMKDLSLRMLRVQEDELRYIARELHDEIGQLLTGLRLAIEMALQSTGESMASLVEAKSLANALTGLVRDLSRKLRPSMLDDLGLFPTLRSLFERFSTHTGVQVVFEHTQPDEKRFSREVETAVYRIVQEALTNVARHAKASWATVRLWSHDKTLGIQVEDHGVGFDLPSASKAGETNGLNVMRERVMLLGGRFTIEANPGAGTRLTAELPTETEGGHS